MTTACSLPCPPTPNSSPQLPPPTAHGRSAAKTHLPTDENALNQLKPLSPLPGLVLEFRALSNFSSKFVSGGGCLRLFWLPAGLQHGLPSWRPSPLSALSQVEADWAQAAAGGCASAAAYAAAHPAAPIPRVHCCWNQTATATGRLSSSAPNLQARLCVCGEIRGSADASCSSGSPTHLHPPLPLRSGTLPSRRSPSTSWRRRAQRG